MKFNLTVTVIVVLYLLVMLFIGWYSSKKITSNTDFMVAGRRLGPFLMAGTLAATEIGGGSSLGVVQQGMQNHGISAAWYIITMGFAFVILTFLAPKFRAATVKTVPEYFRRRYGKSAGLITSIIMLLPLIGLTAGQFIASSVILSTMLGISYKTAVIIVAVVVTIYSIMGGLWSVTLTDFIQVFLIIIGMIIAVPFAMRLAGGWGNVVANVPAETFDMFKGYSPMAVISLTIMYVATFTVGQEAVSRYYAARDGKAAKQGSILAAIINFVYAFIPAILGIITLALINMGKFNAEDFADVGARYALPVLAMEAMPAIICGLLFAGIISATMSSSDSDLLGAGSIFANDIYRAVLKPDATSEEVMKVTKIVMAIVGVVSMFIALFNTSSLVNLLMFCFTLRAAGAFFPYVLGHYWNGASLAGTIASLISGSIVVVYLEKISGGVLFGMKVSQPIIPGLVVALVFFLVFSKIFPPKVKSTELAPEED
ncbi:sodium:solute symporter family protein [Oscillibacter sp.]|uniref:sodium:solute symporter family protein n=1 Tax=Oscillibacter sp. TaxID=1945593 RepID=UPI001B6115A9|nr:sodium:solute symporter family protein [Oscillibacter sp.]MBP3510135.1 sodium:solute symporter family protein [Oscillibacter sp.]